MDDYTREMMDLKTLVTRTLEKKGVLAKILAELLASAFEAIEEEDRVVEKEEGVPPALLESCNDRAKQLHASPSDWAGLPKHLLDMISEKMELLKDCLVFSLICRPWYSVAKDNQTKVVQLSPHQVPMLLVPNKEQGQGEDEWSMYNVLNNKFLSSKLVLPPYDRPFAGSSEGWLVTLDENLGVTLYKPFIKSIENSVIHLPPPSTFPMEMPMDELSDFAKFREYYVMKIATFTPDPLTNQNNLIIGAVFGPFRHLAYIRPAKDSRWTYIEKSMWTPVLNNIRPSFDDIVYYKNKFYAITSSRGALVSFDVIDPFNLNAKLVADEIPSDGDDDEEVEEEEEEEPLEEYHCNKRYLVESFQGDLLHVARYVEFDKEERETKMFKVFKLSMDVQRWVEIKSLGDCALFLGDNTSVYVLASNFVGCQRNSIYFTHDKDTIDYADKGSIDVGVYNLETRICTRGFSFDATTNAKTPGRQPIWVLPTLYI